MTDQQNDASHTESIPHQQPEHTQRRTEFRAVLKNSMVEVFCAYQEHLSGLEDRVKELEEEKQQSKADNNAMLQREKEAQDKLSHVEKKYTALEENYEEATKEITKLNTRLAAGCRRCREIQQQMAQQAAVYSKITQLKDNLIKTFEQQLVTMGQTSIGLKIHHEYKPRLKNLESQLTQNELSQNEATSEDTIQNQEPSSNRNSASESTLKTNSQLKVFTFASSGSKTEKKRHSNESKKSEDTDNQKHSNKIKKSIDTDKDRQDVSENEDPAVLIVGESKPQAKDVSPSGTGSKLKLVRGEKRTRYQEEPLMERKKARLSDEYDHQKKTSPTSTPSTTHKHHCDQTKDFSQQSSLSRAQKDLKVDDRPDITVPETMQMPTYDSDEEEDTENNSEEDTKNNSENSENSFTVEKEEKGSFLNPEVIDSQGSSTSISTIEKAVEDESVASAVFDGCARTSPHKKGLHREGVGVDDSFDVVPKGPSNVPLFPHVEVVRKRGERAKLDAWACRECEQYFNQLGLDEAEKKERMKTCRHKARFAPPPDTPEHYWDVGFPSTQECEDRGYLNTTQARPSKARRRRPLQKLFKAREEETEGTKKEPSDVSDISD